MNPLTYQLELWHLPLVLCVGVLASIVNTLAGGGSILSLPLFIFLGMPQDFAHGTNRMGLIFGAGSASWTFYKQKYLRPRLLLPMLLPVGVGTALGTYLMMDLSDRYFNPILAGVLLVLVFSTKIKGEGESQGTGELKVSFVKAQLIFFGLGLYAGFIQVGAGLVMMFVFSRTLSLNVFQINALKGFVGFFFLVLSFGLLLLNGKVILLLGIVFGVGSTIGGVLGTHLQIKKGIGWVRIALKIAGGALALKLLWNSFGG